MAEWHVIVCDHMSHTLEMKDREMEDLASQSSSAATAEVIVGSAQHMAAKDAEIARLQGVIEVLRVEVDRLMGTTHPVLKSGWKAKMCATVTSYYASDMGRLDYLMNKLFSSSFNTVLTVWGLFAVAW